MAAKVMFFRALQDRTVFRAYLNISGGTKEHYLGEAGHYDHPANYGRWEFRPSRDTRLYTNRWKADSMTEIRERILRRVRKLKDAGQLEYAMKTNP